jgi:hypothetical protein
VTATVKDFVDIGDSNAPVGSPQWCRASHVELCAAKRKLDWEVRHLKYGLLEFKRDERWRQLYDDKNHPFGSWEDYVQYPEPNGLGMPPESARLVIEAINDAELLGDVLKRPGGQPGNKNAAKTKNEPDNVRVDPSYGNSVEYLERVLTSHHPDIAKRLAVGEFRSVRAAAIAAGIVKVKTPGEQLWHWWKKADEEQRAEFRRKIAEDDP